MLWVVVWRHITPHLSEESNVTLSKVTFFSNQMSLLLPSKVDRLWEMTRVLAQHCSRAVKWLQQCQMLAGSLRRLCWWSVIFLDLTCSLPSDLVLLTSTSWTYLISSHFPDLFSLLLTLWINPVLILALWPCQISPVLATFFFPDISTLSFDCDIFDSWSGHCSPASSVPPHLVDLPLAWSSFLASLYFPDLDNILIACHPFLDLITLSWSCCSSLDSWLSSGLVVLPRIHPLSFCTPLILLSWSYCSLLVPLFSGNLDFLVSDITVFLFPLILSFIPDLIIW